MSLSSSTIETSPVIERIGELLKQLPDYSKWEASILSKIRPFFDRTAAQGGLYVFGAHRNGQKVQKYCQQLGLKIHAFVDNDPEKQGTLFNGTPILSVQEIRLDAPILVVSGRHSVKIQGQLSDLGYSCQLNFMEFLFHFNLPFQAEGQFRNFSRDLFTNTEKYRQLSYRLADERSRWVFFHLLQLRLTLNIEHAAACADPFQREYFDMQILKLGEHEVFIDGGAYNGDTVDRFLSVVEKKFKRVYFFEPEQETFLVAKEKFASNSDIRGFNSGLYSSDGTLTFAANSDMDSALSVMGDTKIQVCKLDSILLENPSYIKLDVEGSEEEVLKGATRVLSQSSTKLGIAAYHKATDLWLLTELVSTYVSGPYSIFLRHYSESLDDSSLYFLPENLQ